MAIAPPIVINSVFYLSNTRGLRTKICKMECPTIKNPKKGNHLIINFWDARHEEILHWSSFSFETRKSITESRITTPTKKTNPRTQKKKKNCPLKYWSFSTISIPIKLRKVWTLNRISYTSSVIQKSAKKNKNKIMNSKSNKLNKGN